MIRDSDRMSAWDRAADGLVTGMAWGMVILGLAGIAKMIEVVTNLGLYLAVLPPMPGRPW